MRRLLGCLLFGISASSVGQVPEPPTLVFDQRVSKCENRWFAFPARGGKTVLGYLYVDPQAGFTIEHYGSLDPPGRQARSFTNAASQVSV